MEDQDQGGRSSPGKMDSISKNRVVTGHVLRPEDLDKTMTRASENLAERGLVCSGTGERGGEGEEEHPGWGSARKQELEDPGHLSC